MTITLLLSIYFTIMNGICFILFAIDKFKAKRRKKRISEKTLLGFSLLGGALGAFISMRLFHHKTKKSLFSTGIPLISLVQVISVIYIIMYLS